MTFARSVKSAYLIKRRRHVQRLIARTSGQRNVFVPPQSLALHAASDSSPDIFLVHLLSFSEYSRCAGWPKKVSRKLLTISSPNVDRFSKFLSLPHSAENL